MSEILVASIVLLFMPKPLELRLNRLFNKNRTLDNPYENVLDSSSDVKEKVGAISKIFESLSDISLTNTPEDSRETREVIKKYIVDYIENSCISCDNGKKCLEEEKLNLTVDYIALKLENNERIDKSMINLGCEVVDDIAGDIVEVYNSMKLMRILKEKERESSTKLSNQYKEVSKILSNIAKNIKNDKVIVSDRGKLVREELKFHGYLVYEDEFVEENGAIEYTFVTDILSNIDKQKREIVLITSKILEQSMKIKLILNSSKKEKSKIKLISIPEFEVKSNIESQTKFGETISGDSYLSQELEDAKHLNVISDGAGSGENASKGSSLVINMLEKLLDGGFDEEKSIEIINSIVKMKNNDTAFSTLDVSIIDLKTAEVQFIKLGAAPTYILEDSKVIAISNINIPIGLVQDTEFLPISKKMKDGTIVIQISDGVVSDDMDINQNYFTKYLQNIDVTKSQKLLSEELKDMVIKEYNGELKDDITIIVTKIIKTKQI